MTARFTPVDLLAGLLEELIDRISNLISKPERKSMSEINARILSKLAKLPPGKVLVAKDIQDLFLPEKASKELSNIEQMLKTKDDTIAAMQITIKSKDETIVVLQKQVSELTEVMDQAVKAMQTLNFNPPGPGTKVKTLLRTKHWEFGAVLTIASVSLQGNWSFEEVEGWYEPVNFIVI